jgi:subtilisin family serine protease
VPINSKPLLYPPQVQTWINELHKMGVSGNGVKVALIGTGVDCSHPALGMGFGPGVSSGLLRVGLDST